MTVNSLVDLYGTLSLTSGTFDADGTGTSSEVLTIKSTAVTGDGRIGELTAPGNFTGNVTVERFIDGRSGGDWRYLSLPIASGNLEFWSDDFPVTGNFSNLPPNGVDNVISNTAASAYFYDANADAWTAIDGGGGATSSVAIVNGTGYSLYVYPDNNTNAIVRGEIAKGPISVPIANVADRFNLVGNPYPSTIDGNQLIDNNTTVGQVFSIRTANTQFASYNAFTNTATTANHPNGSWAGEISTGQSFWVQSNGTGASLDFVEADKADNGAGQFLRTGGEDPTQSVFRVVLESDTQVDETVVIFKEGATPELEFFDGEKFLNGDFRNAINRRTHINLSSYNEAGSDLKYVFNVLSNASCDQSVKLRVEDVAEGSHSLSFIRWNEFKLPYKVTLVDNFVNESVELGEDFVYDFEVTSDAASKGSSRFEIFFESQDVDQDLVLATELVNNCDEQFVSWNLTNVQTGIDYFLLSNDIIVDSIRAENGNAVFYVAKQALSEGVNNFDIRASSPFSCALSDKFYSEAVSIDFEPTPSITSVIGDESCSGSVLQLQAFGAPDGGGYKWYESLESNDPIFVAVNGDFETPSLNQTKIYYVAAFNRQGCEGPREIIQATIAELAAPLTTDALGCRESRLELMVSGSPENGFYRWYNSIDDANPIEGETSDSYVIESLTETTRFYVSSVSPDGCESKRVPIIAEVVELETPEVEVQGLLLVAPEADGYQWYRDGEPIQGANLREYEVNASGLYQVDVSSKGCLSRSNGKIFNITSIDDHLVDLGLSIFPNPLTDYLNIKSLKKGAIEDISFDFYDSNGKQVLSDKHYEKINGDYRIDFSNEKSGTYIMNIKEGERYFSLKILKQ
ncbi:MAG: T9SS type A sorting domain-containing protein [Bacteroidota bacterium]